MAQQGIGGPSPELLVGNIRQWKRMQDRVEKQDLPVGSHDIREHVQPHVSTWLRVHGNPFIMLWANEPRLFVKDLGILREVLYNKHGVFRKSPLDQKLLDHFIGKGLVTVDGEEWALSRKIASPAFHNDKIKETAPTFIACMDDLLCRWDQLIVSGTVELDICEEFTILTRDIISRAAFGTSFFEGGKKTSEMLKELFPLVIKSVTSPWNPRLNYKIKRLKEELSTTLEAVIDAMTSSGQISNDANDLLGLMLRQVDMNSENSKFTKARLVDECKTFYVAGHATTATLLTWTMMLLAQNPSWQELARAEVLQVCKSNNGKPDAEAASKMRTRTMILNETLRLYPPAIVMNRQAVKDVQLGSLKVPAGTVIHIPILEILQDPELWGPDVHEFKPERFADGVAKACKQAFAFLPFSHGPRVCIGQAFALLEAKVILAMVLQRFSWQLSPDYRHNPSARLSLRPKHGMPLKLKQLRNEQDKMESFRE